MIITSVNNELVKETTKLLQKKYRKTHFLLEGIKCIEEAIESGLEIERLFVLEGLNEFANFNDRIETTEAVLSKISSTESAPKAVAVAKKLIENGRKIIKKLFYLKVSKMRETWVQSLELLVLLMLMQSYYMVIQLIYIIQNVYALLLVICGKFLFLK